MFCIEEICLWIVKSERKASEKENFLNNESKINNYNKTSVLYQETKSSKIIVTTSAHYILKTHNLQLALEICVREISSFTIFHISRVIRRELDAVPYISFQRYAKTSSSSYSALCIILQHRLAYHCLAHSFIYKSTHILACFCK